MTAHMTPQMKDQRIGLRVTETQRSLFVAASQAEGTTLSDFVLRHATRAAEEVLANRQVFRLPEEQWDEFVQALDRPAQTKPRLSSLLNTATILDA